jgi:phosphatidylinositol-3,4,5-trisphosphate 3-phosphatase/dual-specificity protein phosphatase PTEN
MKLSSAPEKQGISVPSQRRYLYYWTVLLSQKPEAPAHARVISCFSGRFIGTQKVRLTEIVLRMRETPTLKVKGWRAANFLMGHGGRKSSHNGMWASLAKYDDELVDLLERCEKHCTRDEHDIGWRSPGSEHMQDNDLNRVFQGGKWDNGKMVRSFAKLRAVGDAPIIKREDNIKVGHGHPRGPYLITVIRMKKSLCIQCASSQVRDGTDLVTIYSIIPSSEQANLPSLDANSMHNNTQGAMESGVVLDAAREVRVKFYMGNVCYPSTTSTLLFHYSDVAIHRLAMAHTDLPHGGTAYGHGHGTV